MWFSNVMTSEGQAPPRRTDAAPAPPASQDVSRLIVIGAITCAVAVLGVSRVVTTLLSPSRPAAAAIATPRPGPVPTTVVVTTTTTTAPTTTTTTLPPVPASTVLATPKGTIPTYPTPGAAASGTVGVWYGYPLVLPVVAQQPGWLEVRLPLRPNGSTGWVQTGDVVLSSTPYRIVVDLSVEQLFVYEAGQRILAFPAGIGLPATPTVTGNYFVAVREPHPPLQYGPFVLDTSAHSDAISSWEGSGDAIIAIHGPITGYADSLIGATGARVSNGCIRLHDSDLAQMAMIPVGTPVDIYG